MGRELKKAQYEYGERKRKLLMSSIKILLFLFNYSGRERRINSGLIAPLRYGTILFPWSLPYRLAFSFHIARFSHSEADTEFSRVSPRTKTRASISVLRQSILRHPNSPPHLVSAIFVFFLGPGA